MQSPIHSALWHGADYNPEQWLDYPGVWDKDFRLMNAAHMTSATVGIFSWTSYESRDGEYHFDWLDQMFEKLEANGQKIVLATPSGAKPHWLAKAFPEIRRVSPEGVRAPQQARHNHCPTSPAYRRKVAQLNGKLAERYGNHPNLLAWHLSNEYGGYCYCDLCFGAFQNWLRERYNNDLDELNRKYWSRFWNHTYVDWSEIDHIDKGVHALGLDWRRFMTHQVTDFMRHELAAVREHSSVPATTNLMGDFTDYDYATLAQHLDFVSWDAYPQWGQDEIGGDETQAACWAAFYHDRFRSLLRRPFWLMECSPGQTNWRPVSKLKADGVHRLSAWQAVAHGADAVMYFQWRQSRGSSEKFHGAVVAHAGHEGTRTFQEVARLGAELKALSAAGGTNTPAEAALIYDTECYWAIDAEQGPRNVGKDVLGTALDFYRPLWKRGYSTDIITSVADFSPYRLLVAPMLYMLRPGVAERLVEWVRNGGTLVTTYWSGLVNENDLCFLGGFPGPLRELLGLWVEETDTLHVHQRNTVAIDSPYSGLQGEYEARDYCDLIHLEGAQPLAHYAADFYAGRPALTVNTFGQGRAFYIASRNESRFQDDLLGGLGKELGLFSAQPDALPEGVIAQRRTDATTEWVWVMNLNATATQWIPSQTGFERLESGTWRSINAGHAELLAPYDVALLRREGVADEPKSVASN